MNDEIKYGGDDSVVVYRNGKVTVERTITTREDGSIFDFLTICSPAALLGHDVQPIEGLYYSEENMRILVTKADIAAEKLRK